LSRLILASSSPRRAQLLTMLGWDFTVVRPDCGETLPPGCAPDEAVRLLAVRKAGTVAARCADGDTVVAADTLVYLDGQLLGKPHSEAEARAMLEALSGRTHEVYTGLAVARKTAVRAEMQMTRVTFRPLGGGEIEDYIRSGAPMDKAGAYGVQDRGALFVERIEGDFFSVMGLPLCLLGQMLSVQI